MAMAEKKIAFIGGGHITGIIIANLSRKGPIPAGQFIVSDPDKEKLAELVDTYGIRSAKDNIDAIRQSDFIFINVLPGVVPFVLEDMKQASISSRQMIITLAAGVPIKTYVELGENIPVIRALPNPPSRIGEGVAALCFNEQVTADQQADALELFGFFGSTVVIAEDLMDAVTALSSPAPVYLFFQTLIDAGVRAGLDRKTATHIAYQTITGSLAVWKSRKDSPTDLLNEACTPGGVSVESIFTLEKCAFRAAIQEAIQNATAKAKTFAK
jgi:pyrroline-5-carboxylate reductase